ncbi:CDP-alcohol phosphatidyltransferase family protein, partial [Mycoplasmopsis bovis]|uniref:CDP-alcohol phosphatidyltransferase family protein n=1 Tax=Mycoplasmopsis bovis TaxID=28903 RepID=UPI003D2DCF6E
MLSIILAFFISAMITDYLDGWLARKNKQVTTFGKLFDPIADKLIVTTVLISLSAFGFIPRLIKTPYKITSISSGIKRIILVSVSLLGKFIYN